MAKNKAFDKGYCLSVACDSPATPSAGQAVRVGEMTGVALTDEGEGGNAAAYTTVDFGPGVWELSIKAVDSVGNSAVAVGDVIYYTDADNPPLNKKNTGKKFGYALEAIDAGQTRAIKVIHSPFGA